MSSAPVCQCCEGRGLFCCSAIPSACFIRRHWVTGDAQGSYDFESFAGRPWYNDINRLTGRMAALITITGPGGELEIDLSGMTLIGKWMEGQIHPELGCTGNPPDPATLMPTRCLLEIPRCQEIDERMHSCSRHYFPIWRKASTTIIAPLVLHCYPMFGEGGWAYGSGSDCSWSPASHVYTGFILKDSRLHALFGSPAGRVQWDGMLDDPEALDSVYMRYDPDRFELEVLVLAIELAGAEEDVPTCDDPVRYFRPFGNGITFTRGPITLVNLGCPDIPGGGLGEPPIPSCNGGDGSIEVVDVEIEAALSFEDEWRHSRVCGCRRSLPERCPAALEATINYNEGPLDGGDPCGDCSYSVSATCGTLLVGPMICCGANDGVPFVGYAPSADSAFCPDTVVVTGTLCATADGDDEPSCLTMVLDEGSGTAELTLVEIISCGPSYRETEPLGDWPIELGEPTIKVLFNAGATGSLEGDEELPIATWILGVSLEAFAVWSSDDPEHPCPEGSFDLWARTAEPGEEPWKMVGTLSLVAA